eukprot:EG_transcript_4578
MVAVEPSALSWEDVWGAANKKPTAQVLTWLLNGLVAVHATNPVHAHKRPIFIQDVVQCNLNASECDFGSAMCNFVAAPYRSTRSPKTIVVWSPFGDDGCVAALVAIWPALPAQFIMLNECLPQWKVLDRMAYSRLQGPCYYMESMKREKEKEKPPTPPDEEEVSRWYKCWARRLNRCAARSDRDCGVDDDRAWHRLLIQLYHLLYPVDGHSLGCWEAVVLTIVGSTFALVHSKPWTLSGRRLKKGCDAVWKIFSATKSKPRPALPQIPERPQRRAPEKSAPKRKKGAVLILDVPDQENGWMVAGSSVPIFFAKDEGTLILKPVGKRPGKTIGTILTVPTKQGGEHKVKCPVEIRISAQLRTSLMKNAEPLGERWVLLGCEWTGRQINLLAFCSSEVWKFVGKVRSISLEQVVSVSSNRLSEDDYAALLPVLDQTGVTTALIRRDGDRVRTTAIAARKGPQAPATPQRPAVVMDVGSEVSQHTPRSEVSQGTPGASASQSEARSPHLRHHKRRRSQSRRSRSSSSSTDGSHTRGSSRNTTSSRHTRGSSKRAHGRHAHRSRKYEELGNAVGRSLEPLFREVSEWRQTTVLPPTQPASPTTAASSATAALVGDEARRLRAMLACLSAAFNMYDLSHSAAQALQPSVLNQPFYSGLWSLTMGSPMNA